MKFLVTGVNGQLGHDCVEELRRRGHNVIGSDIQEQNRDEYLSMDITDRDAVMIAVADIKPEVIIHCAAS